MPKPKTMKMPRSQRSSKLAQERSKSSGWKTENYYEKGDGKKRAHRLITRGAMMESIAPLAKALTETEFYALRKKPLLCRKSKGFVDGSGQ